MYVRPLLNFCEIYQYRSVDVRHGVFLRVEISEQNGIAIQVDVGMSETDVAQEEAKLKASGCAFEVRICVRANIS